MTRIADEPRYTFRNIFTGATFTVICNDGRKRMAALETWVPAEEYTHWSVLS